MTQGAKRHAAFAISALIGLTAVGCASSKSSTRIVDDPAGEAITYGAPKDITYVAELDAGREFGRITIYQSARCAVIPVTVMQRYRETLHGDKVVERSPVTKTQVAGKSEESIPCDQTYARDVDVMLEVGGDRLSLGKTNAQGEVIANFAELFKVGSLGEIPESGKVLLRPAQARPMVEAGTVSLGQLSKYATRVDELVAKMEVIFAKGPAEVTPEDITRSYELYTQLADFAPDHPKVRAISARFWELFDGRKREEAMQRMAKNLEALSQARDTLKVMGDAAIPLYVQAAVNSGNLDQRALEWSSLRLLRAIKGAPGVCAAGFSWTSVPSYGWPADARLAAQYVHFGYGSGHATAVQHACTTF
jgi:hypothetical protein